MPSIVLTAPDSLKITTQNASLPILFLAGGITNCPDWQAEAIKDLLNPNPAEHAPSLLLVNPRRAKPIASDSPEAVEQIAWEHYRLKLADAILFWFPKETLCPISLYELGKWTGTKKVFIGVHPEYQRKFDIFHQTKLTDQFIRIHDSVAEVCKEVKHHFYVESLKRPHDYTMGIGPVPTTGWPKR